MIVFLIPIIKKPGAPTNFKKYPGNKATKNSRFTDRHSQHITLMNTGKLLVVGKRIIIQ